MFISFQSIELNNFKSFIGSHRLNLTELAYGLHFIKGDNKTNTQLGSNGAGKSTIWDALCWCLFGKTVKGLKNPDVKPWGTDDQTSVKLTINCDDTEHVIKRQQGPNLLTLDDEQVSQETIDDLIRLNFDVFMHTVLLGQSRPLFFDLTPKAKMDLFTEVLGLEKWDFRAKKASELVAEYNHKLIQFEAAEKSHEAMEATLTADVIHTKAKIKAWEKDHKHRLAECRQAYKAAQSAKLEAQQAVEELPDTSELEKEIIKLELIQEKEKNVKTELQAEIRDQEYEKSQAKSRLKVLERKLEKAKEDKTCPECGQVIDEAPSESHLEGLRSSIEEEKAIINKPEPKKIINQIRKIDENLSDYQEQIAGLKAEIKKASERYLKSSKQIAVKQALYNEKKAQLSRIKQEENPHRDNLITLEKRLSATTEKLDEASKNLRLLNRKIQRTKFWIKGFKEIKLHIVDDVLYQLQITTDALLKEAGLNDWSIEYQVEKETSTGTTSRNLNVAISSPNSTKSSVRWEAWSGGESQRLRLVGALALSEVLLNYAGINTDIEVLDEPTQHLSKEGVSDLCNLLAGRARLHDIRVFYVDHMSVESAQFSSVILIEKDQTTSSIRKL